MLLYTSDLMEKVLPSSCMILCVLKAIYDGKMEGMLETLLLIQI